MRKIIFDSDRESTGIFTLMMILSVFSVCIIRVSKKRILELAGCMLVCVVKEAPLKPVSNHHHLLQCTTSTYVILYT